MNKYVSKSSRDIVDEIKLGKAIALMYIAAQGVSIEASDMACDLMDTATISMKMGFDGEMRRSEFRVRSLTPEHTSFIGYFLGERRGNKLLPSSQAAV